MAGEKGIFSLKNLSEEGRDRLAELASAAVEYCAPEETTDETVDHIAADISLRISRSVFGFEPQHGVEAQLPAVLVPSGADQSPFLWMRISNGQIALREKNDIDLVIDYFQP